MPVFLHKFHLKIGLSVWLAWAAIHLPFPLDAAWGRLLVLFAPLVVVPLTLDLLEKLNLNFSPPFFAQLKKWQLPAALSLAAAYSSPQGEAAGLLSLPWLGLTGWVAWKGVFVATQNIGQTLLQKNNEPLARRTSQINWAVTNAPQPNGRGVDWRAVGIAAGMVYLSIGGVWAVFDRFALRPLDYDPEIVFLTVAHFHYAGFVLPIVAGLAAGEVKKWCGKTAVIGIISGVPLVAVGIVFSQLGGGPQMETFAAWWLALAAMLLAGIHFRLAMRPNFPSNASLFWVLAGASLVASMALAGLYGMRQIWAVPGLDIAWMRALHGSANVFGFSLLAWLGWRHHFAPAK